LNVSDNRTRIQLVDDHTVVRSGFRHLLEEEGGFRVVVESESAEQAWRDYLEHMPDIVIMDISMPGIGGLEGIQRILSRDPEARILILTMLGSELVTRVMNSVQRDT
jgi:two-component system invasion response regulator UvrY